MPSNRDSRPPAPAAKTAAGRARLEAAFFALQRERAGLTGAIMQLREGSIRPRGVLRVLVALWRLERANRDAAAALDDDSAETTAAGG